MTGCTRHHWGGKRNVASGRAHWCSAGYWGVIVGDRCGFAGAVFSGFSDAMDGETRLGGGSSSSQPGAVIHSPLGLSDGRHV